MTAAWVGYFLIGGAGRELAAGAFAQGARTAARAAPVSIGQAIAPQGVGDVGGGAEHARHQRSGAARFTGATETKRALRH
jgi:hypothetical protein